MQRRASLGMVGTGLWPARLRRRLGQLLVVMMGLALSLTSNPVSAGTFSRIIVIGDSLSDTGNVFRATSPGPGKAIPVSLPYFDGHFSNGPMWVEALAEALGVQVTSSLADGTNFAFGGAKTGLDIGDLFQRDIGIVIPSLRSQVTVFRLTTLFTPTLSDPTRFKKAPADALYVVWGGANDLRETIKEGTQGATSAHIANDVVGNISAVIRELQGDGAVYFLVPNLPNLGRTPEFVALGPAAVQLATDLSTTFNRALEVMLQNLENTLPIHISRLDTFAHLEEVAANPQRFGLTNVTEACLNGDPFVGGIACANPDGYIFWDAIGHPTAVAQALIAGFAFMALPPLVVAADAHNPEISIRVSLPLQAQPVLQVRLGTTDERVRLSHCTVLLGQQQGDATRVKILKVTLLNDTNANGAVDAGEPVLATQQAQGVVDALTLDITPPLDLLPNTVAHLLVTLDINSAATLARVGSAAGLPRPRTSPGWPGRYVTLLSALGGIGMLGLRGRRRAPSPWPSRAIVCLVGGCCLAFTSCNTSVSSNAVEKNTLAFTISMPAAGLNAEGAMSGPLTQPVVMINGATISLAP